MMKGGWEVGGRGKDREWREGWTREQGEKRRGVGCTGLRDRFFVEKRERA